MKDSMTTSKHIQLGPITLVHFVHELIVEVNGKQIGGPIHLSADEWRDVVDVVSDRTNLVPLTMVVTALLDDGLDFDHVRSLAQISAGTIHFRPNDRKTHEQAREVVGTALGL